MERVNLTDARTGRTITIPAAWLPKPATPAPKAPPKRKTKKAKA